MYPRRFRFVYAVAAGCVAATLAACGPSTITSTPDPVPLHEQPGDTGGEKAAPAKPKAKLGDTITLAGNTEGLKIAVTPTKVVQKGTPANAIVTPKEGFRLFAVTFEIKNVGTAAYDDSPSNCVKVVDTDGQEYSASLGGEITQAHTFGSTKIAPGDRRRGALVFEVPESAEIDKVQYTPESGFGPETGEWHL